MKIIDSISDISADEFAGKAVILAIGSFDGIHLGHQRLLMRTVELARNQGGISVVMTFKNHPLEVLAPYYAPKYLTLPDEKKRLLEELGVDVLIMPKFEPTLANLPADTFVADVLIKKIHVSTVVCGFNYRFGRGGKGDVDTFRTLGKVCGFCVDVIPPFKIKNQLISSTHIRELIKEGEIVRANTYLSRQYSLEGTVTKGSGIGKKLGFPTANIVVPNNLVLPASGVYAVKVNESGETYGGMLNIGNNPTFPEKGFSIEVNIFDFDRAIYDKPLTVFLIQRMRDEISFDSPDLLKQQLQLDEQTARDILSPSDR